MDNGKPQTRIDADSSTGDIKKIHIVGALMPYENWISDFFGWETYESIHRQLDTVSDGIDDQLRFLVKNGLMKREDIVAMVYAKGERYVVLDPDIAAMKSFSTTAKMRLQRMRDAEAQASSFLEDGYYRELGKIAKRLLGGD